MAEGLSFFAKSHNEASVALYGQLRQRSGNLFFSPFSIRAALAMTFAGARGETATQMSEALRFPSSDEKLHSAFAEVIRRLNRAGGDGSEVNVANSLWGQEGPPLRPEFVELLARHYGGDIRRVDFRGAAAAARLTINRWIEHHTSGEIRDIISPGGVDDQTRLVLVNTVYFKGMREAWFHVAFTEDAPFYLEGGGDVWAPLMRRVARPRYLSADGFQAVDLDYEGGTLSMLMLLPDRTDGLGDMEDRLSASMLDDCVAQMSWERVVLYLPRFRIGWGPAELGGELRELGMPLAFRRFQADFSGINRYKPPNKESLSISGVLHWALVEVYEEETEPLAALAAAMQGAVLTPEHGPMPEFRADHPFLFAIRDRETGAILFLGRVTDPTRD